jgi:hypothetical protein
MTGKPMTLVNKMSVEEWEKKVNGPIMRKPQEALATCYNRDLFHHRQIIHPNTFSYTSQHFFC